MDAACSRGIEPRLGRKPLDPETRTASLLSQYDHIREVRGQLCSQHGRADSSWWMPFNLHLVGLIEVVPAIDRLTSHVGML